MFARASKQRLQPDTYKQWHYSSEALHLPWLCPVLCNGSPRPRKTSTISRTGSKKKSSLSQPSLFYPAVPDRRLKPRGLASAVQAVQDLPQGDFIPFEMSPTHYQPPKIPRHSWPYANNLSTILDFTPESTLMISENHTSQTPKFRSVDGISGDVVEITQTMLACIQVDHLTRAASLMRRLNKIYKSDAPELIAAHNEYLRGLYHKIERTKDPRTVKDIHKWFEMEIRGAGLIPDAKTYALMILATFHDPAVKDITRTIKRYITFAKDNGVWEDTRSIVRILSDKKDFQTGAQVFSLIPAENDAHPFLDPSCSS